MGSWIWASGEVGNILGKSGPQFSSPVEKHRVKISDLYNIFDFNPMAILFRINFMSMKLTCKCIVYEIFKETAHQIKLNWNAFLCAPILGAMLN